MSSEIEEILDQVDLNFKSSNHFEVVSTLPDDHHHFNTSPWQMIDRQFLFTSNKSKTEQEIQLWKRIEQEWEILKANLPNSIYVRAYENRRDLMRIVVIALEGSPYSYALFFDIFFPGDYPSKPPQIFHHPNYALSKMTKSNNNNGANCSVFNDAVRFTWDSKSSNVFGMLRVIQLNLLMKSKIYSKDVDKEFLLSHMAILSFLRYPPLGFEDFVKGYLRKYSHNILLKFKGKGSLGDKSTGISRMFFTLYDAFEKNGSYRKHLVHVLDSRDVNPITSLIRLVLQNCNWATVQILNSVVLI